MAKNTSKAGKAVSKHLTQETLERIQGIIAPYKAAIPEVEKLVAEYNAAWKKETGVTPPEARTAEEIESVVIPWWQEQAALAGIDAKTIIEAGEDVADFEPIIRGKLRLVRLQALTLKRRRRRVYKKKPTQRQLEVVQIVGECKGVFAEAARRMNLNESTIRQHYYAGLENADAKNLNSKIKNTYRRLPQDHRGQADAFKDDSGEIRPGSDWKPGSKR